MFLSLQLHCVRCIWDCGCRLGDQFCCVDLPTVSSYDRGARQAVDSNASEYLKLALHPYWESSLPPGIAAADEELPVVDMSEVMAVALTVDDTVVAVLTVLQC